VYGDESLESLAGLDQLSAVGGGMAIYNNVALPTLAGLGNFVSVAEDLMIVANYALTNLDGLSALTSIGESYSLWVVDNTSLPQCEACALLEQLEDFSGFFESSGNQPDTCSDYCF